MQIQTLTNNEIIMLNGNTF